MKKKLLTLAVILSLSIFSTTTFGQDDSGGYSGGEGGSNPPDEGGTGVTIPTQPTAVHFTRNNGDGTCGGLAQIRMYYTIAPTVQPELTQIYYQGEQLYSNFSPVKGNIVDFATKGYVSFCLSTDNIPPAIKLTLTYKPGGTNQPIVQISGTD